MKIHALAKRLEALGADVSMEDRVAVESVRKKLSDLEDKLVFEIMTTKH
jgi:translation initiation factor 6 (eIF-6)